MSTKSYDLIVIGGGPAGYVAVIRAAQLGMRTALVEREQLGGICLNWGCIPTKALLHAAEVWRTLSSAKALGIHVGEATFDFKQVIARSRTVSGQLTKGVRQLMAKHKVTVVAGEARLDGRGGVNVTTGDATLKLDAPHIVVATGARPKELPGASADGKHIWSYRHALAPAARPQSLLIVGAGAIGMEFASFYATLGTAVTVIEGQSRVLPAEDDEVSAFIEKTYRAQGIDIRTNTTIDTIQPGQGGAVASLRTAAGSETLKAEHVLVSIGVVGNTEGLGFEGTRVQVEAGHVVTDPFGATAEPGIYAIGDVAGAPWLAHKASHEAIACIERIAGLASAHAPRKDTIPSCTYGHPQTASVGLTERAAAEGGRKIRVGRFPFRGNGKAIALNEADGFVKTIFDADTGEFLGAHLVGPQVTELIHSFGLARIMEATEVELMQAVFPHPTLSETLHESVLSAFDRALHI
ncbi:MAG: dihydrolipoyl dehydrogenase [Polaromonas sp.]|nr:dihydrolipoyl dehydrogenase [Polaromonas sp.]